MQRAVETIWWGRFVEWYSAWRCDEGQMLVELQPHITGIKYGNVLYSFFFLFCCWAGWMGEEGRGSKVYCKSNKHYIRRVRFWRLSKMYPLSFWSPSYKRSLAYNWSLKNSWWTAVAFHVASHPFDFHCRVCCCRSEIRIDVCVRCFSEYILISTALRILIFKQVKASIRLSSLVGISCKLEVI